MAKKPQIKFTVTDEARAYLRWYAQNILLEESENAAARHITMRGMEQMRRKNRGQEPGFEFKNAVQKSGVGDESEDD